MDIAMNVIFILGRCKIQKQNSKQMKRFSRPFSEMIAVMSNFTLYSVLATRYSRCRAHFNIFPYTMVSNSRL